MAWGKPDFFMAVDQSSPLEVVAVELYVEVEADEIEGEKLVLVLGRRAVMLPKPEEEDDDEAGLFGWRGCIKDIPVEVPLLFVGLLLV